LYCLIVGSIGFGTAQNGVASVTFAAKEVTMGHAPSREKVAVFVTHVTEIELLVLIY
jgi:hypothetical protein